MADEMPELSAYFSTGSLVDSVVNMGAPAPIDIQISGSNLPTDNKVAQEIAAQLRAYPDAADVFIPTGIWIIPPSYQRRSIARSKARSYGKRSACECHNFTYFEPDDCTKCLDR